jgi:tRNA threonylcarbamoyladenosine biosynthesis protein TsaE
VRTPVVIALRGELGAGKSVLARAVARGAGVRTAMPSPTFNLLFRYETPRGITISHLDLYRLEDPEEVWELGWRELGEGNEIVLIEWPERAEELLPAVRWDITLEPGSSESTRVVTAYGHGHGYEHGHEHGRGVALPHPLPHPPSLSHP